VESWGLPNGLIDSLIFFEGDAVLDDIKQRGSVQEKGNSKYWEERV